MSTVENLETQKSYKYLQEVEEIAQDILTSKEEKISVANTQNKLREALRALENVEDRYSWMQMGSIYIQRRTDDCKEILKNEISKSEVDLNDLHNLIREKTHKLRDLEHQPRLEGFTLKPISVAEAKTLHKSFGLI